MTEAIEKRLVEPFTRLDSDGGKADCAQTVPENGAKERPRPPSQGRLLDLKAASAFLGLSVWQLRRVVYAGAIPYRRIGERKIYIDRLDLEAWIGQGKRVWSEVRGA